MFMGDVGHACFLRVSYGRPSFSQLHGVLSVQSTRGVFAAL